MKKYVNGYYSVKKLQATYVGVIPSITDKQQWPAVDKGFKVFPPMSKKKKDLGDKGRIGFSAVRRRQEKQQGK